MRAQGAACTPPLWIPNGHAGEWPLPGSTFPGLGLGPAPILRPGWLQLSYSFGEHGCVWPLPDLTRKARASLRAHTASLGHKCLHLRLHLHSSGASTCTCKRPHLVLDPRTIIATPALPHMLCSTSSPMHQQASAQALVSVLAFALLLPQRSSSLCVHEGAYVLCAGVRRSRSSCTTAATTHPCHSCPPTHTSIRRARAFARWWRSTSQGQPFAQVGCVWAWLDASAVTDEYDGLLAQNAAGPGVCMLVWRAQKAGGVLGLVSGVLCLWWLHSSCDCVHEHDINNVQRFFGCAHRVF